MGRLKVDLFLVGDIVDEDDQGYEYIYYEQVCDVRLGRAESAKELTELLDKLQIKKEDRLAMYDDIVSALPFGLKGEPDGV